jgi:hypothetical protein
VDQSDTQTRASQFPIPSSGRKKSTVRKQRGSLQSCRHVLAPYDAATLARQKSWANAHKANDKEDARQRDDAGQESGQKRQKGNDFGGGTFWNRPTTSRRKPPAEHEALSVNAPGPPTKTFIVDTGASHVLFQRKHMDLLTHVQFSGESLQPFAILRAANGQELTAIGRGIFTIKHISVIAYLFRDEDPVHNLLGMAPFADCGCTAVFTSRGFNLYHRRTLLITGKRHSTNLWHVSLCQDPLIQPQLVLPAVSPTAQVLLLHEDTRKNKHYVQFMHACLGSPPPTTFLQAVHKGYLAGENQFPRLTAHMVRKHMPNSIATARGHLNKSPIGQPHAASNSVSARKRLHRKGRAQAAKLLLEEKSKHMSTFDPTSIPKSTTIHLDYTGRMPARGSCGTLCYQIATWGSYIHLEPLTNVGNSRCMLYHTPRS